MAVQETNRYYGDIPMPLKEVASRAVEFPHHILFVGFGAVGQGALPLLLRHLAIPTDRVAILSADEDGKDVARQFGVALEVVRLDRDCYREVLAQRLRPGDFLVNASLNISSVELVAWCQQAGVLYIDACVEPWAGEHMDAAVTPALRSNYAYREQALALRSQFPSGPTAMLMHGANPGLVSHFVKEALSQLAAEAGIDVLASMRREDWAQLAMRLGIRAIQVAERDGQVSGRAKLPDEFVNTWSCPGFYEEAIQPAELGWGTHEKCLPPDGREHDFGCKAGIYLDRPGLSTRVRSWVPHHGAFHGWLISHGESLSIADYLTVREGADVIYRPTCYYAYHPCDQAVLSLLEFAAREGRPQSTCRVLRDELVGGMDELGVLLMGPKTGAYWYGSQLDVHTARTLCPFNNATTLQVNAPFVAAILWAMAHPQAGIVEPEEIDHHFVLQFARPYLGKLVGAHGHWTPLQGRSKLFAEEIDAADPWQFTNFLVR
ncbi:homospermidine synthase [Candidatus Symbiobacter mobilis]|nr:saccharopine dehydrogenase C-terminal domain-containing protein [Candidatus Symbiobacter mobilis]